MKSINNGNLMSFYRHSFYVKNKKDIDKRNIIGCIKRKDIEQDNYVESDNKEVVDGYTVYESSMFCKYYLTVKEDEKEKYIGIKDGKLLLIPLGILAGILVSGVITYGMISMNNSHSNFIRDKKGVIKYNDEDINKDGPVEPNTDMIDCKLYDNFNLNVSKSIPLTNPTKNTVFFKYFIKNEQGQLIYTSKAIGPGQQQIWVPKMNEGKSKVVFDICTYENAEHAQNDLDGTHADFQGFNFDVSLKK